MCILGRKKYFVKLTRNSLKHGVNFFTNWYNELKHICICYKKNIFRLNSLSITPHNFFSSDFIPEHWFVKGKWFSGQIFSEMTCMSESFLQGLCIRKLFGNQKNIYSNFFVSYWMPGLGWVGCAGMWEWRGGIPGCGMRWGCIPGCGWGGSSGMWGRGCSEKLRKGTLKKSYIFFWLRLEIIVIHIL